MSKLILEKLTENQLETLRILLDENRIANDIEILLILQPLDTYGCIKTTGICENDFFLAHGCFLSPLVAS